jgi:hypothetical protein
MVNNGNTQNYQLFQSILDFTLGCAQKAAVVFKLNVSGISTQQIVYSANLK